MTVLNTRSARPAPGGRVVERRPGGIRTRSRNDLLDQAEADAHRVDADLSRSGTKQRQDELVADGHDLLREAVRHARQPEGERSRSTAVENIGRISGANHRTITTIMHGRDDDVGDDDAHDAVAQPDDQHAGAG